MSSHRRDQEEACSHQAPQVQTSRPEPLVIQGSGPPQLFPSLFSYNLSLLSQGTEPTLAAPSSELLVEKYLT